MLRTTQEASPPSTELLAVPMSTRSLPIIATMVAALAMSLAVSGVPRPAVAAPVAQNAGPVLGCNDEPVQERPYAAAPFKQSRHTINLGYGEWHFPPSCDDQFRRDWVKIYRVVAGKKDPRVYFTTGDRWAKKFKKGKYRGKARYSYRYYEGDGQYGPWHSFAVTTRKNIKLG